MGRRIIQSTASKQCEGLRALGTAAEEVEDPEYAMSLADAKEQYLCNIPPHRYRSIFKQVMFTTVSNQGLNMTFFRSAIYLFIWHFLDFTPAHQLKSC